MLGIGGTGSQLPTTNGNRRRSGPVPLQRPQAPGVSRPRPVWRPIFPSTAVRQTWCISTRLAAARTTRTGETVLSPAEGEGNTPPQMQDAFGTRTRTSTSAPTSSTALDVVGYNMPVPEPGTMLLTAAGLAGRRSSAGAARPSRCEGQQRLAHAIPSRSQTPVWERTSCEAPLRGCSHERNGVAKISPFPNRSLGMRKIR